MPDGTGALSSGAVRVSGVRWVFGWCIRPPGRVGLKQEDPLNSSLVGKIEKARRYADERAERIRFSSFRVEVRGENETHEVRLQDGRLICACEFYAGWGVC